MSSYAKNPPVSGEDAFSKKLGRFLTQNGLIIGFIVIVIALSLFAPRFFHIKNLINIVRQVSINGILAIGETFVILLGGIDLSVGSGVALAGVLAADMHRFSPILVFALPLFVGALAGFINGAVITRFRVPPFVITLGMMTILRGVTFLYTNGQSIYNLPGWFKQLGQGDIVGLPIPVLVLFIMIIVGYAILHHTRFGRYVYAIIPIQELKSCSGKLANSREPRVWK